MLHFRRLFTALVATLGLAGAAQASVVTFDSLGDSGAILFAQDHDGASLSATASFTLISWTQTTAKFSVAVDNDSTGTGMNRLLSFGIGVVSPALTQASATGAWSATVGDTLPSFNKVDLCMFSANNCAGGNVNQGLGENGSALFDLNLTTTGDFLDGISFISPYGVKFQSVGNTGGSFEFAGCVVGANGRCDGNNVPEPATLALVGLGLLGAAALRRRRV